jgi:cell division protein FtsB
MRIAAALPRPKLPRPKLPRSGLASFIAVLLVTGLVLAIAVEPTRQLLAQGDRIDGMAGELAELNDTNRTLQERIDRLQDPDYLEREAREVGLVRPGETAYVVMPPGRKARMAKLARERAKIPPPQPPEPTFVESLMEFMGL